MKWVRDLSPVVLGAIVFFIIAGPGGAFAGGVIGYAFTVKRRRLGGFTPIRDRDFDRMGLRVEMGPGTVVGNAYAVPVRIDARPLTTALDRLTLALHEVGDAWEALPPAAREHVGTLTLTLGGPPPSPSVGPSDEPRA